MKKGSGVFSAGSYLKRLPTPFSCRTKQKGTALLRCPPAPLVWLPQQFTAPCRNQTSDLSRHTAMGVPTNLRGKLKNAAGCGPDRNTTLSRYLQICHVVR